MRCLRCGYCCIEYDVMIVDNPELGPIDGNIIHKPSGQRCQHLIGNKAGEYSCAIHDKEWYNKTPCYDFGQIENSVNDPCRMGQYILSKGLEIRA